METHLDRVLPNRLDRLRDLHLTPIDDDPLAREQLRDLLERNGAEEPALRAGLSGDFDDRGLDLVLQRLQIVQLSRLLLSDHTTVVVDLPDARLRREGRLALREEKVPCKAGLDGYQVARMAELLHVLAEDQLNLGH